MHGIERRQGVRKGRLTPTLCNGEARDNAVGPLYTGCLYSYHVLRVIPTLIPDSEYSQNEAPGFWAPFQLSASSCGQTRCIKPRLFSPSNWELLTTISPVQVERSKFQRRQLTILEGSSFFLLPRSSLSAKTRILEGHQSWANHRYRVHRGCTREGKLVRFASPVLLDPCGFFYFWGGRTRFHIYVNVNEARGSLMEVRRRG